MRLVNHTDITDAVVRDIIRAVKPAGLSKFDVRVSNASGRYFSGRAYARGSGYHDTAAPFVVVKVQRAGNWRPFVMPKSERRKGYLHGYVVGSRLEALVFILAHELRHLWQGVGDGRRRGMVWGARGKYSERDADAYALRMLRRFRRGELRLCYPSLNGRPYDPVDTSGFRRMLRSAQPIRVNYPAFRVGA